MVNTLKLNSGYDMPQVGLGTWKIPNKDAPLAIYNAIKAGYRLIDCACDYGNEVECGQGVARAIKEGLVKRSDLFIVSKLWNTFHDPERVEPIARRQLKDWGLDYFDLYVMHFPVGQAYVDPAVRYPPGWFSDDANTKVILTKTTIGQTWAAMEALVDKGLARSLGVSNFQGQSVYELLRTARIPPATLQVEHHPYLVQPELMRLAKNEGITVTAYSSFGPISFTEFKMRQTEGLQPLFTQPVVLDVAKKTGKTPGQVLLRWSTQQGIAVIPKTHQPELQKQNLDIFNWDISKEDIERLNALDRGLRFNQPSNYFPTEALWIFS